MYLERTLLIKQKQRLIATSLVLAALSAGLLTGCGSGGDSTPNPSPSTVVLDPVGAAADVTRGQGQINTLINASTDPTSASLASLTQTFASAYAKDPTNAQAAMGLAVGGLAQSVQNVINVTTGTSRAASAAGHTLSRAQQTTVSSLQQTAQSALPWKIQRFDGKTGLKSVQGALNLPITLSRFGHNGGRAADVTAVRQSLVELKTALDKAIPLVQQSANKADFTFAFPDFETNTTGIRTMDQADATSFLTSLYALRGILNIALAYDPTYGNFDFNQKIQDRFAAKQPGDHVTPDEYLPAAPFLNLTSGGKAAFTQAQGDFAAGADNANAALTLMSRRASTSGLHLIDSDLITAADYTQGHDGINQFKAALFASYTTTDSSHTVVNLSAWFNNPPASLRSLLPTYTVSTDSNGTYYLASTEASFPDLTFGGLIGNANPASFDASIYGDQAVSDLATNTGYVDYSY